MNMFKTDPGPNRAQLGFAEAVLAAFKFLTKEYGFRLVKAEPTFVRYESPSVFVNLYHGRASYELGFEIGRLIDAAGQGEHPFSLDMVIELMGGQKKPAARRFKPAVQWA